MKWFSFPRLFQRRNRRKTPSAPEGMAEPPKAKQADEPNAQPEKALIDNIQLTSGYTDADGGYRFSKAMANPGFIGVNEIQSVYLPMGFSHFKIEGRGLGSALALEFLLYYLTKPEYQIHVREAVYLDNMLDLF